MFDQIFATGRADDITAASGEVLRLTAIAKAVDDREASDTAGRLCQLMRTAISETGAFQHRYETNANIPHAASLTTKTETKEKEKFFSGAIERQWREKLAQLRGQASAEFQRLAAIEAKHKDTLAAPPAAQQATTTAAARSGSAPNAGGQPMLPLTQKDRARSVHLLGHVVAVGPSGCLVDAVANQSAVSSHMGSTGMGGNSYAPPSSDVAGTFIVGGVTKPLTDGDLVDVQAVESGIIHGFNTATGGIFDGTFHVYRAFPAK
jgi:hypothetical protein